MGIRRDYRQPGNSRAVANITGLTGGNMDCRLARCGCAVVTSSARLAAQLGDRVREARRQPRRRQVTAITGTAGHRMFYRLDLRALRRIAAGVAIQALTGCSCMAHGCRSEGRVIFVAGIALGGRRNMSGSGWLGLCVL